MSNKQNVTTTALKLQAKLLNAAILLEAIAGGDYGQPVADLLDLCTVESYTGSVLRIKVEDLLVAIQDAEEEASDFAR